MRSAFLIKGDVVIRFGSAFAGIGGLDLGFERSGMECSWQVEIDDYATRILAKRWPNVRRWDDIQTFPPGDEVEPWRVDVIAGGFPCQDISLAGKGGGLAGERSGLFFEIIRLARLLQPRAIVLENVAALLARGMGAVLGELAAIGFDAEWHCIPAAAVGAPHIRDRVFVVGYANSQGEPVIPKHDEEEPRVQKLVAYSQRDPIRQQPGRGSGSNGTGAAFTAIDGKKQSMANTTSNGWGEGDADARRGPVGIRTWEERGPGNSGQGLANTDEPRLEKRQGGEEAARALAAITRNDWWATEPAVARVANGLPRRVDRLRGLGNAVVPQVAEVVGRWVVGELTRRSNPHWR